MILGQEGERPSVWTWDSWRWGFPEHSRTQGHRHPEPAWSTSLESQGELSFAWTQKEKGVSLLSHFNFCPVEKDPGFLGDFVCFGHLLPPLGQENSWLILKRDLSQWVSEPVLKGLKGILPVGREKSPSLWKSVLSPCNPTRENSPGCTQSPKVFKVHSVYEKWEF